MPISHRSFTKVARALTAFLPYGHRQHDCQALQEKLDAANPAEIVWGEKDYETAGVEYPAICVRTDPGDGLWVCCCGHENRLVHYRGAFPFKYLNCGRCDHILCPDCRTTEILTPVRAKIMLVEVEQQSHQQNEEVRFCRLCRSCGLSHRASMDGCHVNFRDVTCPCGKPAITDGSYFYIGDVDAWRCDPAGRAVEMNLERQLAASERAVAKREKLPEQGKLMARDTQPRLRPSRVQTYATDLGLEARPQQPPRAATLTDPTLPIRRGAVRRPREQSPTGGRIVRTETGVWAPKEPTNMTSRHSRVYFEGRELRAVNC
ncbi:Nn.00g099770.m01.CDS01 [Neocucurbitaria sp. VM-36]